MSPLRRGLCLIATAAGAGLLVVPAAIAATVLGRAWGGGRGGEAATEALLFTAVLYAVAAAVLGAAAALWLVGRRPLSLRGLLSVAGSALVAAAAAEVLGPLLLVLASLSAWWLAPLAVVFAVSSLGLFHFVGLPALARSAWMARLDRRVLVAWIAAAAGAGLALTALALLPQLVRSGRWSLLDYLGEVSMYQEQGGDEGLGLLIVVGATMAAWAAGAAALASARGLDEP